MYPIKRAALLAASTLVLAACGAEPIAAPAPSEVSVAVVESSEVQLSDMLPGRVIAVRVAEIRPQVGGIIQRRLFQEGSIVRAGQPLYQINAAPFLAESQSAAASVQRAEATLNQARTQRDRLKPLLDVDAVSRQVVDDADAAFVQAQADVAVARANLARRNLDVSFATVTSPIAGRIGASSVTEGALVSATGGEAMATVHQLGQVYVDVSQPYARLEALRGMAAGSDVVELLDSEGAPLGVTGRLLFSELTVDPGTGDAHARVLVDNAAGRLLPGMFVRVRLPRGAPQTALRIPQQSVAQTPGGAEVLVVGADGKVQSRSIKLGEVIDNRYIVLSGLRAGERVVVEGRELAKPNTTVTTRQWRSARSNSAGA